MSKILHNTTLRELGAEFKESVRRHPRDFMLKVAMIVLTIGVSILLALYLGPIALLPIPLVIGITAASLMPTFAITSSFFYSEITKCLFSLFKKNHTIDKISNKDVVLVLEAKEDHNGAFQMNQRSLFHKVEKKYAVAFEQVSSLYDIAININKTIIQNNRIKAIWFRGHGNPAGICLNKNYYLDITNVHRLERHFCQIDPNGYIILDSCSTAGQIPDGQLNFAETLSHVAKQCTIVASSRNTDSSSIKLGKDNLFDIKMWTEQDSSKHPLWKYPSRLKNGFKSFLFFITNGKGTKCLAYDATKVYRHSPVIL